MNLLFAFERVVLIGVTILLAIIAGTLLIGGPDRARRPSFLDAWAIFCWLGALSGIVFLLRGHMPDLMVIAIGNALLLLAWSQF